MLMLCKFMSITEIKIFFLNFVFMLCLFFANVCQCHIQTYQKYSPEPHNI